MKTTIFMLLQHLLPQGLLSRTAGMLASNRSPAVKNFLIRRFIRAYGVNMLEARRQNPEDYLHFNDFFCRELREDARHYSKEVGDIISPADGAISQAGCIDGSTVLQAKGKKFSLTALFGGNATAASVYHGGNFATIYLSPKDYHRIHMPAAGELQRMLHIPGSLFSVNKTTAENLDELFARNERVVVEFATEFGPMAMVYVGAMIVASIETPWSGLVAPRRKQVQNVEYNNKQSIYLNKGEECGRFRLGSTVILLFPKNTMHWAESLQKDSLVRMGETIGRTTQQEPSTI